MAVNIPFSSDGSVIVTKFISPVLTAAIGTGDVITITPPTGQRVKLVFCTSTGGFGTANNLEFRLDGVAIKSRGDVSGISAIGLSDGDAWSIGSAFGGATTGVNSSAFVEAGIDEILTVNCSGSMAFTLQYQYHFEG